MYEGGGQVRGRRRRAPHGGRPRDSRSRYRRRQRAPGVSPSRPGSAALDARRLAEDPGDVHNRIESHFAAARLAIAGNRFADAGSELRAVKPLVDKNRDVDLRTRWATLPTENALAQHQAPGGELEQLRKIAAGAPKASVLTAEAVLARATHRDANAPLAEAHRLGLVLVKADSGAATARQR